MQRTILVVSSFENVSDVNSDHPRSDCWQTTSSHADLSPSEKKVFFKDIFILGIINLSEK